MGEPWRTQAVVRQIVLDLYNAGPAGLPGNDDLGQMSAWYIFATLGLYPAIPGVGGLVIGSPLFPRIALHLAHGTMTISAPRAGATSPYVQRLRVDGRPWTALWIPTRRLAGGASLRFDLGAAPDRAWGSAPIDAPPSYDAVPLHAPRSATVPTGPGKPQRHPAVRAGRRTPGAAAVKRPPTGEPCRAPTCV